MMNKTITLLILTYLFSSIFLSNSVLAEPVISAAALDEPTLSEEQEARFVLLMMKGRAIQNTRVPALILDSVQGIIWICQSVQDDRPIWSKTDLGQNGNKPLSRKKYIGRILEWQEANLKVPAIVLDIDDGKAWTCSDIITNGDTWVLTDFKNVTQKEIRGTELKY
jgi:hypothetical protein